MRGNPSDCHSLQDELIHFFEATMVQMWRFQTTVNVSINSKYHFLQV